MDGDSKSAHSCCYCLRFFCDPGNKVAVDLLTVESLKHWLYHRFPLATPLLEQDTVQDEARDSEVDD